MVNEITAELGLTSEQSTKVRHIISQNVNVLQMLRIVSQHEMMKTDDGISYIELCKEEVIRGLLEHLTPHVYIDTTATDLGMEIRAKIKVIT